MEESWRNRSAADHQLMYEDLVRHPNRAPNRYASYTEGQSNASKGIRINRGVRRAYDAVRLWPMHFPKALGKFWRVVLKSRRCPALERRQRHFTRLRGAVWPCPWFGQVLLVIVLCVVEAHRIVACSSQLRGDRSKIFGLECFFVSLLARLKKLPLLIVKPVEPGAVLRATVITLPHALSRVVSLPEPTKDVHERDLGGVVDNLNSLCVSSHARAHLFIRRVRSVARRIPDGGGVYATTRQPPYALLGAPETSIGEDCYFVAVGPGPSHWVAENKVLGRDHHLSCSPWKCGGARDHRSKPHDSVPAVSIQE
mmetsp:Transcript_38541/g.88372  ORF Transcript_38541/g.88372 Transcript_38541/m.88372 type:complete len:311 (-) Transcript_38541:4-936(-)